MQRVSYMSSRPREGNGVRTNYLLKLWRRAEQVEPRQESGGRVVHG